MRLQGLAVCLAVLLALLSGGATAGIDDLPFQTNDIEADGVLLRADVDADGDAAWTVEYRIRLDGNRTAAFESLRSDIETNESRYRDQFTGRMERTVATAENATGREMGVGNVSVTTSTQQLGSASGSGYGFVTYRFEWAGFAAVDGGSVFVGDALAGLYLDEGTRLVVSWPDGYEAETVRPSADDRRESAAVWSGPLDFGAGEPRVVAAPARGGLPTSAIAVGAGLLAVTVGVAWWRRNGAGAAVVGGDDGTPPGAVADDAAGTTGASGDTGGAGPVAGAAATGSVAAAESGTDESDHDDADEAAGGDVPLELLSPEERVLRVVRERGGRMKQQEVVSELDWSAARTSQVVGSLRESGELETFRLGRENVLKLPEEDLIGGDDDGGDGDEGRGEGRGPS
jgi:hypothetical protein